MKINVGTTNQVKIAAVVETLRDYQQFAKASVVSIDVENKISEQPLSLDETIAGARLRARQAFQDCHYSFGIEDGLLALPQVGNGYLNVCACLIYDGQRESLGLSPAFPLPDLVVDLIINQHLDMSQAFYQARLTEQEKLGANEGAVGLLTANRLRRQQYTQLAIMMALIGLR